MKASFTLSLLVAGLFGASAAEAATLTNRDTKDYKVTIIEGDKTKDHVVKPTSILKDICAKGCIIRLNDSENDEYELDGTEIVSIEEGYLYYDVPDTIPDASGQQPKPEEQPKR